MRKQQEKFAKKIGVEFNEMVGSAIDHQDCFYYLTYSAIYVGSLIAVLFALNK
jgi:hypothetical protein